MDNIFLLILIKSNAQETNCGRTFVLRTEDNIERKMKICFNKEFEPCKFVNPRSLNGPLSHIKKGGKKILLP